MLEGVLYQHHSFFTEGNNVRLSIHCLSSQSRAGWVWHLSLSWHRIASGALSFCMTSSSAPLPLQVISYFWFLLSNSAKNYCRIIKLSSFLQQYDYRIHDFHFFLCNSEDFKQTSTSDEGGGRRHTELETRLSFESMQLLIACKERLRQLLKPLTSEVVD